MRTVRILGVALLLAMSAWACESRTTIPAGAQQVQVSTTPTSVRVTPSTARPGDVYVVLVPLPAGVRLALVRSASGGGLSEAQLTQLWQNEDAQGLRTEVLDVSCCGNV